MTDNVDPEAIDKAPISPTAPSGPTGRDPFSDPDLPSKRGLLGCVFGYGAQAKTMIVAICLLLCFAMIAWLVKLGTEVTEDGARAFVSQVFTAMIGITGGLIGYLTGKGLD